MIANALGPAFALSGRNSKDFFTRNGDLRNISELNFWPLEKVLEEKYKYDAKDAAEIASFLGQMLKFNPLQRASAQECLRHSWLADAEKGTCACCASVCARARFLCYGVVYTEAEEFALRVR